MLVFVAVGPLIGLLAAAALAGLAIAVGGVPAVAGIHVFLLLYGWLFAHFVGLVPAAIAGAIVAALRIGEVACPCLRRRGGHCGMGLMTLRMAAAGRTGGTANACRGLAPVARPGGSRLHAADAAVAMNIEPGHDGKKKKITNGERAMFTFFISTLAGPFFAALIVALLTLGSGIVQMGPPSIIGLPMAAVVAKAGGWALHSYMWAAMPAGLAGAALAAWVSLRGTCRGS